MPSLSALGGGSLGVWTRSAALDLTSRHVVQRLLDAGIWQVVFAGVYADGGYVLSAEQRAVAAVLASGGAGRALACGRTAARAWGLPLIDDDDPATGASQRFLHDVHVQAGLGARSGPAGAQEQRAHVLRRHRLTLGGQDLTRTQNGLWVTTPLRTAVDCARLLTPEASVCLLDDGLRRGLFSAAALGCAAAARAGSPGSRACALAVGPADGRAESPAETLARLLLLPVLPRLAPQVRLYDRAGRLLARFDLADEEVKLAVDIDGKRGHAGAAMVAKDRSRDRRTEPYGWWTERGTWFELRRGQRAFVARVVARHTSRAA